MCDVEKIDMEQFIMEVEKKTCIWDIRSEEYKDRKRRDTAWREICCTFFPNFAELPREERKSVSQKLQLKWRNIRDYYRKYTKKETKSGSGASKRFKYIFADQLTFLAPLLEMRSAEASGLTDDAAKITEERAEGNCDGTSTSTEPVVPAQTPAGSATKPVSKPKKIKLEPKQNQSHENFSKTTHRNEDDDDRLFFDSLLPVVRTFDIDQKLEFRSEVLRVLQRVRCTRFLLQRYQYQTPTGQTEYASASHLPNIYNQALTPHSCEEASTHFRETPQKQNQNTKTPAGQSNETEIVNTESPESDLSTFSDDNEIYSY